jgi:hypothetical protein
VVFLPLVTAVCDLVFIQKEPDLALLPAGSGFSRGQLIIPSQVVASGQVFGRPDLGAKDVGLRLSF